MKRWKTLVATVLMALAAMAPINAQDVREWTDSTGRFKINGSLIEVKDDVAYLRTDDGKTIKIPVNRLSKADQEFLKGGDNPFEMVTGDDSTASESTASGAASGSSSGLGWNTPVSVNWDLADELATMSNVAWNVPIVDGKLPFEGKPAPLAKKSNFHEHVHTAMVNATCKRAVLGFGVTFSVPTPLSRLTLIDLVTGKSVHSETVEANMRPIALLNSGSDVVMVGKSDGRRSEGETKDQLQIWRFNGKKIERTGSWIPYPDDVKDFGKLRNGHVLIAEPVRKNRLLTMSDKGHLALWDIATRKPIWHARFNGQNFAMDVSMDRKLVALVNNTTIMVVNIDNAEILGSKALPNGTTVGWPRILWGPDGDRLLFTSLGDVRVLDVKTGEWIHEMTFPQKPIAPNGLSFPDNDFALLNNNLLVHLPTKIQVCDYQGANSIKTLGGVSFIAVQGGDGGVFVPSAFPHPAAAELLETAKADPSLFLIHPGVAVSIDVTGVPGQHRQAVRTELEKSVVASGYRVAANAPIRIFGSITGPKQEAVSYIASGSYIVNKYTSMIKMKWQGQELWSRSGSNVPGVLMTKRGQTMQQALDEAGRKPNISLFGSVRFPEMMQKPKEGQGPQRTTALMTSKFTPQGLVDSK